MKGVFILENTRVASHHNCRHKLLVLSLIFLINILDMWTLEMQKIIMLKPIHAIFIVS